MVTIAFRSVFCMVLLMITTLKIRGCHHHLLWVLSESIGKEYEPIHSPTSKGVTFREGHCSDARISLEAREDGHKYSEER